MTALIAATLLAAPQIHSLCDISHEFTFYMDGRFHRQYIGDNGVDARNWGTLSKADLSNINLLVLPGGDSHVPYSDASIRHVLAYVREGGTLVVLADRSGDSAPPVEDLTARIGLRFQAVAAQNPLKFAEPSRNDKIEFAGGNTLNVTSEWRPVVVDAANRPTMARRKLGKGNVLVGVRNLFGNRPDASDPINAVWIQPMLLQLAKDKPIDPSRPPQSPWAELTRQVGPLTLEFHEGTRKFADDIAREYLAIRPILVEITGVEPAPGMITKLLMLPTGGGGFSSGERIAIGAWWGDYPKNRYPMVELIGHEAGHSWVLPYPEPVWNEPIATYLGVQVGKRMGMPEAQQTLDRAIARAREIDPDFTKVDLNGTNPPNAVVWGKSYFIYEQLEREIGPGAMAKYFRAKRRLAKPGRKGYSMDDAVAVWSHAAGKDLFPWFRKYGTSVDAGRTDIPLPLTQ